MQARNRALDNLEKQLLDRKAIPGGRLRLGLRGLLQAIKGETAEAVSAMQEMFDILRPHLADPGSSYLAWYAY